MCRDTVILIASDDPEGIVDMLKLFGAGTKTVVEAAIMTTDATRVNEEIVASVRMTQPSNAFIRTCHAFKLRSS